ncbi:MAG TPA: hypothetical protein VH080_09590, partial [Gemmatimonadaceae bacterium]|nr:hypothetical protein [Gemmatimonadaceae bacterium]
CSGDTTGPNQVQKPASDLHFLQLSPLAPALQATTVSFYAKKGEDREARVKFQNGEDYLRFRVFGNSLLQRPDGGVFAQGDSILITITVTDPTKLQADFQPAGLKFSPSAPARLQFEFGECDGDINGDGVVNAADTTLLPLISTWRQETPGAPWIKVSSTVETDINEVQAFITGFTGYALAY